MRTSPSQPSSRARSATARIGTLATLPVFFDLKGKPVLVIGGTEGAAWKAELLAAAGADVEVHASEFCNEMTWKLVDMPTEKRVSSASSVRSAASRDFCAASSCL